MCEPICSFEGLTYILPTVCEAGPISCCVAKRGQTQFVAIVGFGAAGGISGSVFKGLHDYELSLSRC